MKNFLGKKYVQIGITAFCVIAASMLFYFGIFHTASIARRLNHCCHRRKSQGIEYDLYHPYSDCICSSNIICSMAGYPFYGAQCGLSDL